MLPPMECGTYLVDDAMVAELRAARRGEHSAPCWPCALPRPRASTPTLSTR
jgi:butyrate kinase